MLRVNATILGWFLANAAFHEAHEMLQMGEFNPCDAIVRLTDATGRKMQLLQP